MDVATVRPAQRLQTLVERDDARLRFRIGFNGSEQHTDAPHPLGLLRARRERPRRRAAEQRDEVAPFHSITSSARASSVGGSVGPSDVAVFRLTTNSNLVPCCTGRSAGFAPLRILSTKLAERYHMSLMLAEEENRQPASAISRTPQISGRRWRAAAAALPARAAVKVAPSSTKT